MDALLAASASLLLAASPPGLNELARLEAQYAPVELRVDVSKLPEGERKALARLVQAAQYMDAVFLRQRWAGNPALLLRLSSAQTPLARAQLRYFLLNRGPWDGLDHNRPFLPGVPEKPAGGNFYPPLATKEKVSAWEASLSPEQRARPSGFFTTVRQLPDGSFTSVPYSEAYQGELALSASLLREAAELTAQPTLKAYLEKRAAAFLSNDYYPSDVAWMELDSSIEPTIGPYEVYEDGWFNAKAAFEAFIAVRDEAASARLARFSAELQALENTLPLEERYKNPKLGALAPIRVVNSLFCAGDANRGVQTAAFNLPNDERVLKEKGSKRVMLKNVQEAKYQRTLLPIARVALTASEQPRVSFEAFFTHILMHELMHGLGPHNIQVGGRATTVRQELQDSYSALEEAKADISGLWALQQLVNRGVVEKSMEQSMYVTYLASTFRSLRFGLAEAHGKGVAVQLNWLLDAGAVKVEPDGRFSVVPAKIAAAVRSLTEEILGIQATGDGVRASALLQRLGVARPEVKHILDKLGHVPVDISPRFTTAQQLLQQYP